MSDAPALVYLEADDEVTTVVRRVRQADARRVVLVAPGRSRATSSVVALRLLAAVAEDAGVRIEVVGDALTRSLAAEAGLGAYASVDDARNSVLASPGETISRRASIHVVRGGAEDDTATVPAVAAASPEPIDEATQLRPVPVAARPSPAARPPSRRGLPIGALLVLLGALVLGVGVAGAIVLPAATIVVSPLGEPLGPVEYEIEVADPERIAGTVEGTATVTATGTYPIQVAATGTVVLFNWTSSPVAVAAGTFVAAGEQAFATQLDVVVPRGTLTSEGTIAAGDIAVAVAAAALGPDANVPAGAIDTVVDQGVDQQLRGFPENPESRVVNPEATSGGVDTTGPEITQADVEAAVAALRADLDARLADALGSSSGAVTADADAAAEPAIEGLDGVAGTRDQAEARIAGTLVYDRLSAERTEVIDRAEERLADDETVLPAGHDLLAGMRATIGGARADGDRLIVDVTVSAASAPRPDREDVLERVRGRSADEAEAALAAIGSASVELWPAWVGSVPELDWRINVRIGDASGDPVPSATP